ncbi:MAG: NTP transferase domain-containing protein, partial [Pyrinomonadaceae bacterium]
MEDTSKIGIIILAAGSSTRLGRPKQLLEFRGKTFLRQTIETALQTGCQKVYVVLGANYAALKRHVCDLPIEIVRNSKYKEGMMSSLKSGLRRLLQKSKQAHQNIEAVVVMLCDQPLVEAKLIRKLIRTFREKNPLIV